MARTIGVRIETSQIEGRLNHIVYDLGVNNDQITALPDSVVEALKKVNELAYSYMGPGSDRLVAVVQYRQQ